MGSEQIRSDIYSQWDSPLSKVRSDKAQIYWYDVPWDMPEKTSSARFCVN